MAAVLRALRNPLSTTPCCYGSAGERDVTTLLLSADQGLQAVPTALHDGEQFLESVLVWPNAIAHAYTASAS